VTRLTETEGKIVVDISVAAVELKEIASRTSTILIRQENFCLLLPAA
jgi:hypothetical protein